MELAAHRPSPAAGAPARREAWILCALTLLVAGGFAALVQNAWDDWYITFRASKNLALGNGLLFSPGERVHSFTSPIGTVLPALLSFATGAHADELVLWLFRLISVGALAAAVVVLNGVIRHLGWRPLARYFVLALLVFDAKTVAFSTNGMETAFLVLFVVLTLHAFLVPGRRPVLRLGLAWAGLQWVRPDGFVIAAAIALGMLVFLRASPHGAGSLKRLAARMLAALPIALAAYLPWLIGTWIYYGTPIPHTIAAKGALPQPVVLWERLVTLLQSFYLGTERNAFAPAYSFLMKARMTTDPAEAGWHGLQTLPFLNLACAGLWLIPARTVSMAGRAFSLAFLLAHSYAAAVIPFAYPWYWPAVSLLGFLTLGAWVEWLASLGGEHLGSRGERALGACARGAAGIAAACLVLGQMALFACVAVQLYHQQRVVEWGHRRQIGLYLKAHARSPSDTVFTECLGYVGFYSGLRTYDFPGMSSPEVVAARKRLGTDDYGVLIHALEPDWLVLRPHELENARASEPDFIRANYHVEQLFDVRGQLTELAESAPVLGLPGHGYLRFDEQFYVLRREAGR